MANKVKYGLKNVHVFPISSYAADGTPTYGTAIKWPGAVSITMDAVGEPENFHADNLSQHSFQTLLNSLSLIILRIPRELSLRIQVQNLVTSEWHSSSKVM